MSLQVNRLIGFGAGGSVGYDIYTVLMLHMDGLDASTTFLDSSPSGKTVTASGDAQIDTAQSVFGGASGLFDGTGDYIEPASSADFSFGTGDFTIDCRVRLTAAPNSIIFVYPSAQTGLYINAGGEVRWLVNGSSIVSGATLSLDTWYHVAYARSGTAAKLFVDGVSASVTDNTNYGSGAIQPTIGANSAHDDFFLTGWLDEFRVSKGIARWTSDFTPPAAPYS